MSAQTIHEFAPATERLTEQLRSEPLPRQRSAPQRTSHLALVPDLQPVRRLDTSRGGLTRRGRLAVTLGLLVIGALLAFVLSGVVSTLVSGSAGAAPTATHTRTIVVQPGQTLWTIARDIAPTADRRTTIARIVELNGLPGTDVAAGSRLTVPTR